MPFKKSARIGSPGSTDAPSISWTALFHTKSRLNEADSDFVATWQSWHPAVRPREGGHYLLFYLLTPARVLQGMGSQASLIGSLRGANSHEFCHPLSDRVPKNFCSPARRPTQVAARMCAHAFRIAVGIPERWA